MYYISNTCIRVPQEKMPHWDGVNEENLPYFLDYKTHFPPTTTKIGEENGGASYSPNVAYLAHWGRGGKSEAGFFLLFSSSKT